MVLFANFIARNIHRVSWKFSWTWACSKVKASLCCLLIHNANIFTARVHTYDGRLCFHRCVSVQLSEGGYPIPGLGRGVPHPRSGLEGGVPHPRSGEVPHPRSGWRGTPSQVWPGGYPISGWGYLISGWGVPPDQVWMIGGIPGVPPHTWDGVPPYIDLGWGTPWPRPGMGYPPHLRWGTPYIDLGQGTPLPRPGMEYPPT